MLGNFAWIFFISMVPLVELRGAIPVSQALKLPVIPSYAICILGNMLPVPLIFFFARRFLERGRDKKFVGGLCLFFLEKGAAAGQRLEEKSQRGIFLALLLFVGIPIPGTGAWTGTLAASLLGIRFSTAILAVMLGIILAGLIMMAGSFGLFSMIFN